MDGARRFKEAMRRVVALSALLAGMLGGALPAAAQDGRTTNNPRKTPLVLQDQGSFFIGGRTVHTDALTGTPTGFFGTNAGSITVDQMYVQYQIPEDIGHHVPVVLLHGCCLSGKTYETTPDGRMGWGEYFVRQHRPVYVPDQSSRARSGFDATIINEVKLGKRPLSDLPVIWTVSHEDCWTYCRFGPTFGTAFSDEQFPVEALDEFGKQAIPDLNDLLPEPNPTWTNLAALAVKLGGAVLVGHSESGFFPERTALINPTGVRGLISVEPSCPTTLTPPQIAALAKIPTLVIFGDHLADVPAYASQWMSTFSGCQRFIQQVNAAGGDAQMMHLPELGLFGNSHVVMEDKNSLQVADLILAWIDQHVEGEHGK